MKTTGRELIGETDARKWAAVWVKMVQENPDIMQEDCMLSWFANAIMSGYDAGYQRALEIVEDSIEKPVRTFLKEIERDQRESAMETGGGTWPARSALWLRHWPRRLQRAIMRGTNPGLIRK